MNMHNPPHPGEFIAKTYMAPCGLSCRYLAEKLGVAASTLNRILKKQSGITPGMALRLSYVLGRTPESWLMMQDLYDLREARRTFKSERISPLELQCA
jgi:antitoxin HigA-1